MGLDFETEVSLPVIYQNIKVTNEGFRLDFLIEDTVIIELKSVEKIQSIHN